MPKLFLDITISLDGFVAAPGVSLEHPFGTGSARLHDWLMGTGPTAPSATDREVAEEMFAGTGAFLIGRRTFDVGIGTWGEDGAFGVPCFVVTSRGRERLVKGPTTFTFVSDGVEGALGQARAAAGDRDVCIMGGGSIARQLLAADAVDELRLHVAAVLLRDGTRLFEGHGEGPVELEATRVRATALATHLRHRVARNGHAR